MLADFAVILFAAHHLADYPLQTDHQAAHKADRDAAGWRANLAHSATHVAVSAALVLTLGALLQLHIGAAGLVAALVWIGASHSVIDRRWPVARWMAFARQAGFAQHGGAAYVDQAFHLALGLLPAAVLLTRL